MTFSLAAPQMEMAPHDREAVESKLRQSLARYTDRVRRIAVRVRDVNGPRGGNDTQCTVEVSLYPRGFVVADVTDENLPVAVSRASDKLVRLIREDAESRRSRRRRQSRIEPRLAG